MGKYSPYPEEMNRQMTDAMTDLYFVSTNQSKANLLKETIKKIISILQEIQL